MATYASTTNPFIEPSPVVPPSSPESLPPSEGTQVNECLDDEGPTRQARKPTPGMARPKHILDGTKDLQKVEANKVNFLLYQEVAAEEQIDTFDPLQSTVANNNGSRDEKRPSVQLDIGLAESASSAVDKDAAELEMRETSESIVESTAKLSVCDDETISESATERTAQDGLVSCCQTNLDGSELVPGPETATLIEPAVSYRHNNNDEDEDNAMNDREDLGVSNEADDKFVDSSNRQRQQHVELMRKLRLQLRDLERYAYERGELKHLPPSVLVERQSVILEKLRKRLSLNLDKDKIERLELDELKKQVDEEINALMDPLITKEHLLSQLKTQLTDLERYISHLHGALGKGVSDKSGDCSCSLHGCTSTSSSSGSSSVSSSYSPSAAANSDRSVLNSDTLPKTSRLIRGLMAQLICSDMKIQEAMKLESEFARQKGCRNSRPLGPADEGAQNSISTVITTKPPQFHDGAAWTLHIDRVTLATDSLANLYSLTPKKKPKDDADQAPKQPVDESLVESVVRRQLIPAIRDLLSYGLIDPNSLPPKSSYVSFLVDPYYLLTSFSCLPGLQAKSDTSEQAKLPAEKLHIWNLIEDYYESRNEVNFKTSSVKTLSQSFNLTPTLEGPIKITSKQALLITIDDIVDRLAKRKPNGPESHLRLFVYTALNQHKLATWLRIILRSKSTLRKYYHDFSFASQPEKMEKFLATLEVLSQFSFNIDTDTDSSNQFVSAF